MHDLVTATSRPSKASASVMRQMKQAKQGLPAGFPLNRGHRICLVTNEFHGLFKNGGIGTANTGLAQALAVAGYDVTVAYANADENGPRVGDGNFDQIKEYYRRLNITLDYVPAPSNMWRPFDEARSANYCVYLYLRDKSFDIIYFNECGGHAYYSLLAKRTGVFPGDPTMHVVTHGPHEWLHEINSVRYYNTQPIIISYLERRSVELADTVISPSDYLLKWIKERGWALPDHTFVEQNIVGVSSAPIPVPLPKNQGICELVFFGRQEIRKGLKLFCDALDSLAKTVGLRGIRITFLGKFSRVEGLHSGVYILSRSRQWSANIRFLVKMSQEEATNYLKKEGVLAVMPSLAENSPCVVVECAQHGIPFIATDSGGTAELLHHGDRKACLVAPEPRELANKLSQVLKGGQTLARLAVAQEVTISNWLQFHAAKAQPPLERGPDRGSGIPGIGVGSNGHSSTDLPLVSVCLVHHNNPHFLEQSLGSVLNQSYQNYEVTIVDDGSSDPRALAALREIEAMRHSVPVKVVYQTIATLARPGTPGSDPPAENISYS